jgi:hypothetical protein
MASQRGFDIDDFLAIERFPETAVCWKTLIVFQVPEIEKFIAIVNVRSGASLLAFTQSLGQTMVLIHVRGFVAATRPWG